METGARTDGGNGVTRKEKLVLAWLIVIGTLFYIVQGHLWVAKETAYPLVYRQEIMKYATQYHVQPELVAAVILTESKYTKEAQSHRGAIGLMQIMPDTGKWIAEMLDEPYDLQRLKEPDTNIRYGTWYLAYLLKEFHGNMNLALAAYNAGRGHVEDWMLEKHWDYGFEKVSDIPFTETREYVIIIKQQAVKYKELYGL